ncbi:MAG: glycosyltransferase family 2 protein [bacterium]|nr:glycosyltransferase family 2 protein [bacterium]
MKLIVQIPCHNEAPFLEATLRDVPRSIPGVDEIEFLVVDDGSTDETAAAAVRAGVRHVVRFRHRRGLAQAFMAGLDASLRAGADIIVNTDADNQYCGADIPPLIAPILRGEADMVIGDRDIAGTPHFSPLKKALQRWGSWAVRRISGTDIPDCTSGFRAYNREAALRINIVSQFTYTLESIIQGGKKNLAIAHVPVRTNSETRESRLFSNMREYVKRSLSTMVRIYTMYESFKVFIIIGSCLLVPGAALAARFLYFYFTSGGAGHIQSLIFAAIFTIVGFQVLLIGLVADIISSNRRLIEDALYRIRRMELRGGTGSRGRGREGGGGE